MFWVSLYVCGEYSCATFPRKKMAQQHFACLRRMAETSSFPVIVKMWSNTSRERVFENFCEDIEDDC